MFQEALFISTFRENKNLCKFIFGLKVKPEASEQLWMDSNTAWDSPTAWSPVGLFFGNS